MVKVGGEWNWNVLDKNTRFLLASNLTRERKISDARECLKGKTKHVRCTSLRTKANNNVVERFHNEYREFDKVRCGWKNEKTAQKRNNGFMTYHNFIKKHSSIDNMTPSQKAGVNLTIKRNR